MTNYEYTLVIVKDRVTQQHNRLPDETYIKVTVLTMIHGCLLKVDTEGSLLSLKEGNYCTQGLDWLT